MNAMSQHLTTLNSYVTQFTDLDSQQQTLLTAVREQTSTLDNDSRTQLTRAIPFITEQNKVMESVETRVNKARAKFSEQTDNGTVSLTPEFCLQANGLFEAGGYQ
jgi:hypothetical protein